MPKDASAPIIEAITVKDQEKKPNNKIKEDVDTLTVAPIPTLNVPDDVEEEPTKTDAKQKQTKQKDEIRNQKHSIQVNYVCIVTIQNIDEFN